MSGIRLVNTGISTHNVDEARAGRNPVAEDGYATETDAYLSEGNGSCLTTLKFKVAQINGVWMIKATTDGMINIDMTDGEWEGEYIAGLPGHDRTNNERNRRHYSPAHLVN